jgi:hypothetical protein
MRAENNLIELQFNKKLSQKEKQKDNGAEIENARLKQVSTQT